MYNLMKTICALAILACPAIAQNEIDHIATLYPSGYGKMAIDSDTLYVNILNGHGVERYDMADPANPIFIDREEVTGFDQIDFARKLMTKAESGQLLLADFSNFNSATLLSQISLLQIRAWKLAGNYFFIAAQDSIRVYNISDPANPSLCDIIQANTTPIGWGTVFGSTICVMQYDHSYSTVIDYYNISEPNNIYYTHSDSVAHGPASGYGIGPARGDTMFAEYVGQAGYSWQLYFISFAPNDTSHFPSWGEYMNGHPRALYSNDNSFLLDSGHAYSFNNFYLLGIGPPLWDPNHGRFSNYEFDCTLDNNFIVALPESISIFQPTNDSTLMPQIGSAGPGHFGVLSSASYGNYILSGAESNGGELLVHHLEPSGNLNLVAALSDIPALNIIIDSSIAFCLCSDKITAIDISYPENPVFLQQFTGFNGTLVDFAVEDSLIFIATDQSYNIVHFDIETGFELRSTLDLPGSVITSIVQYHLSYLLKGSVGTILKINPNYGEQPYVMGEYRLPHDNYVNMDLGRPGLWASGDSGLDITSFWALDPLGHYGPEYFADARQFTFSGDTVYVADGIGGVKIFTSHWQPEDTLHYIGGYSTGNVVNQLATIGDNFFVSDYYSLQHLRWGAPTGIEGPDSRRMPEQFSLMQNYPNPFNAQTTISYNLPRAADVTLDIFDILGRKVETLIRGYEMPGVHFVSWDAKDFPSGIYFYKIKAGDFNGIRKCILLK